VRAHAPARAIDPLQRAADHLPEPLAIRHAAMKELFHRGPRVEEENGLGVGPERPQLRGKRRVVLARGDRHARLARPRARGQKLRNALDEELLVLVKLYRVVMRTRLLDSRGHDLGPPSVPEWFGGTRCTKHDSRKIGPSDASPSGSRCRR